jgi:hypothetical protein
VILAIGSLQDFNSFFAITSTSLYFEALAYSFVSFLTLPYKANYL